MGQTLSGMTVPPRVRKDKVLRSKDRNQKAEGGRQKAASRVKCKDHRDKKREDVLLLGVLHQ